ncbi:MAG: glycosyltransferase [bacterium]|nr:glycosyltransferase [bacterium]
MVKRSKPKLVGYLVVKDEAWIIKDVIASLSEFCDEIVAVDDGSTDGTVEILQSFPKVVELIQHHRKVRKEASNVNEAMRRAQGRGADWLLRVDADEIFSANAVERIPEIIAKAPPDVGQFLFVKLNLWRGTEAFRADRPELYLRWNGWKLHRNVPGLRWKPATPRLWKRLIKVVLRYERWSAGTYIAGFLEGLRGRSVEVPDVFLLHYNWCNWERLIKKSMKYTYERKFFYPKRNLEEDINRQYLKIFDESNLILKATHTSWFPEGYRALLERGESEEERKERERLEGELNTLAHPWELD